LAIFTPFSDYFAGLADFAFAFASAKRRRRWLSLFAFMPSLPAGFRRFRASFRCGWQASSKPAFRRFIFFIIFIRYAIISSPLIFSLLIFSSISLFHDITPR
jgi:hypothetical protein